MRKRFGVNPSLTLPGADSSNLVAYDIAETLDKIKSLDEIRSTDVVVTTDIPVLGSFAEGFYDPVTAKPRRIPFEVVQYDRRSGKTKLSYSAAAMDTANVNLVSQVASDKGKRRGIPSLFKGEDFLKGAGDLKNSIVLNFNIPGLVAMNHPDKNLNGGSSEFFILQEKDRVDERSRLLNGSYAPFGYVLDGLDLLQSLQPGDKIRSTHVDEWGKLNLVTIRKLSLRGGMATALE
jgi:cyclophilin family peptidyl-prolyl cis-trans isomerase